MKGLIVQYLSVLILCLCMVSYASAHKSHPSDSSQQYQCDANNRPTIEECYPLDYAQVCAYYTENCPLEVCGMDRANSCYACRDNTVLYYKNGPCRAEEVVSECEDWACSGYIPPGYDRPFEPVCGIKEGGKKRTFDNVCEACSSRDYNWYQYDACLKDRHNCGTSDRGETCENTEDDPVCAHLTVEDNSKVYTTAANGCNACADQAVDYYIEGECGMLVEDRTYCLPNSRPDFCTEEYNPVCGFYLDETGTYQHKILDNPCFGCRDPDVVYHIPGPCVFTCNRDPGIIFECVGFEVEPICGVYQENGREVRVSLKNACIGCYNVPILIDSYTEGLCPGDEGIYCANDAGGFLQGVVISPVCGLTEEGCSDSSCRTTFSEPLFACAATTTLLFQEGLCPGDFGISCDPFREELPDYLQGISYGEVCGSTVANCNDSSCRSTYSDQTVACSDASVLYFTGGACA